MDVAVWVFLSRCNVDGTLYGCHDIPKEWGATGMADTVMLSYPPHSLGARYIAKVELTAYYLSSSREGINVSPKS